MSIDYEQRRKDLEELVSLPLDQKFNRTISKIYEFYSRTNGNCYLSCSGGADSMVLYDIVKRTGLDIDIVFDDTGLEEPTVRERALSIPNIQVVRPSKSFWQVLTEIGYPIVSKEVSECVNNARRHFDGGGYERHTKRLLGLGEFASKSKENTGDINQKGYP